MLWVERSTRTCSLLTPKTMQSFTVGRMVHGFFYNPDVPDAVASREVYSAMTNLFEKQIGRRREINQKQAPSKSPTTRARRNAIRFVRLSFNCGQVTGMSGRAR